MIVFEGVCRRRTSHPNFFDARVLGEQIALGDDEVCPEAWSYFADLVGDAEQFGGFGRQGSEGFVWIQTPSDGFTDLREPFGRIAQAA